MDMFEPIRLTRFYRHVALFSCALLLGLSLNAHADTLQDANKLFKQGQSAQALEKVNGYLAAKPKDAQARFLKGLILTEQGNSAEAIRVFTALTEDYPELPEPYNNLAVLYAGQGQYDKAKQALEMAIRTHPSYATAHENLGDIYAKMASQAYDRALQLDRSNTATQTKLSMIQDLFAGRAKPTQPRSTPAPTVATASAQTAPAAAAAKPTATKPAESSPSADPSKDVLNTVNAWAAAWSAQNVDKYLSFYAPDFKTPGNERRSSWEATRRERISAPRSIKVTLNNISVKFADATHAEVKFRQSYRASHMKASGNKTLLLVNAGGKWLIQEERSR